jgi:hypothetical protein
MARFGNINEFTYFCLFYLQNEMLRTINIRVFSLVNSFHIVLSGTDVGLFVCIIYVCVSRSALYI